MRGLEGAVGRGMRKRVIAGSGRVKLRQLVRQNGVGEGQRAC